jgi:hypothetical protein
MDTLIPNRGKAGAALDATNNGLTRVEGGAVWVPSSVSQGLLINGVIPATAGLTEFEIILSFDFDLDLDEGSARYLFGNNGFSTGGGVLFRVYKTGGVTRPQVFVSDGSASQSATSSGLDLEAKWLRVAYDGTTYIFEYSKDDPAGPEPTTWTPLTPVPRTVAPSAVAHPSPLGVFRYFSTSQPGLLGIVYFASFRDAETGGAPIVEFNAAADISDPSATSLALSTGQTCDVVRPATGPVTTLVPTGTVVYINPDDTDSANKITTASDPAWTIAADQSAVLCFVGQVGTANGGYPYPIKAGVYGAVWYGTYRPTTGNSILGYSKDDAAVGTYASANTVSPTERVVTLLVIDRAANLLRQLVVRADGSFTETATGMTGSFTLLAGATVAEILPGSVSAFAFDRFDSWDQARWLTIAAALLANANRPPISTIGALPPPGYKVRGDTYTANNGHSTLFNGSEWISVTPTTGNLAALLGNNQLLLGTS